MIQSIEEHLKRLADTFGEMSNELYVQESHYLFGSSIGQHIRHILEMYDTVLKGYPTGQFSFDNRDRNKTLEENIGEMFAVVNRICHEIKKTDKELIYIIDNDEGSKEHFKTTYFRELLYCFEHGIHHQALIKVALKEFGWKNIPDNFGVAPSTIKFRLLCAQ